MVYTGIASPGHWYFDIVNMFLERWYTHIHMFWRRSSQNSLMRRELLWFEFRVFLLDRSPYQYLKAQSALPSAHSWRENSWLYTFSKVLALCEMQAVSSRIWTSSNQILDEAVCISHSANTFEKVCNQLFSL